MTNQQELIVVKDQKLEENNNSTIKGTLKIVYTRNTITGEIKTPDPIEFKTQGIWISRGYDEIDQRFQDKQLFLIENYGDHDSVGSFKSSNYHDHWATNAAAKALESNSMLPVIKAALPDKSSGSIKLPGQPPQDAFFILNENYIYGPFTANMVDDEITVTPDKQIALSLQNHHIAKIPLKILEEKKLYIKHDIVAGRLDAIGYIVSMKSLGQQKDDIEEIDYITDTQLITFFAKNNYGKHNLISRKEAESLKCGLADFIKRKVFNEDDSRVGRLNNLLDEYLSATDTGSVLINNHLDSEKGQKFLKQHVQNNPDLLNGKMELFEEEAEKYKVILSELESKKKELSGQIKTIERSYEQEAAKSEKIIQEIREKTEEQAKIEREKVAADIEREIREKEFQLAGLEDEIRGLLGNLQEIKVVSDLQSEVKFLERRDRDLSEAVRAQEQKLKSPDLPKEISELKTMLDLLQGRIFERPTTKSAFIPLKIVSTIPNLGSEYVQGMVEQFDDAGRGFSFEEMANLIISVQQSFLTVLKGQPGSGKTSTAIRLAQAHQLLDGSLESDSFLNIPVSRGWVSGRDFLGFYNTMKDVYQPSKTGLYQFLRQSGEDGALETLRLVLLDEANLSPIEHYWSDFLAMCDIEGRNRSIDTGMSGENRFLSAASNLRFIATINNDNTTEPLSPRLCDRVPVISMDIPQLNSNTSSMAAVLDGAVPYKDLESFFGRSNDIESDEPMVFTSTFNIFEERDRDLGSPIMISKRKRLAMQAFYDVACSYMESRHAVDFALSQHALPLINGYGKPFKNRLVKLREHATKNNLSRTVELLDGIIEDGDAYVGSYSFF